MVPSPHDALLVLSFGGPEEPEDVMAFLENVTRGRGVPRERLEKVAEQYQRLGGRSPINEQSRALVAALQDELGRSGSAVPVYFGNRNWHPFLADTVRQMAADGIRHAAVFATSAWSSYSSCRQYREDLAEARAAVGGAAPTLHKLRPFFNHPGFVEAQADRVRDALAGLDEGRRRGTHLVFTAHSIPQSMAEGCDYQDQLLEASRLVSETVGSSLPWDLAYQSRSGPPQVPWLGPDVSDHLADLAARGVEHAVVVPIGFVSDHMEVRYDLDVVASERAAAVGIELHRAPTVGTHPRFVRMVLELVEEAAGRRPALAVGRLGPRSDRCPDGCCPQPAR